MARICCGRELISARENYKRGCLVAERDPSEIHPPIIEGEYSFSPDPDWVRVLEFDRPGCGKQVETEYLPPGHPITVGGDRRALAAIRATIGMLRRNAAGWPSELDLVCRWYGPHLERIHEDAALRQADLLQLAQIASTYPSRERFLTELTLDPPEATSDEAGVPLLDEDYLILSTIHSAKGQEWAAVFLLNTVDGCLPSDLATG